MADRVTVEVTLTAGTGSYVLPAETTGVSLTAKGGVISYRWSAYDDWVRILEDHTRQWEDLNLGGKTLYFSGTPTTATVEVEYRTGITH